MNRATILRLALLAVAVLAAASARAVTLSIDYTYDASNFFGAGNPQGSTAGAQARASLEAAADFFSTILDDSFSAIQTPPNYYSRVSTGIVEWDWSLNFANPSTGASVVLDNRTIAADEYRIYAGARNLSGSTLGIGGPGGYSWSSSPTGTFSSAEIDEINQITDDFSNAVENRGETSGFAGWGGAIAFDRDSNTTWHYSQAMQPTGGTNDFYSVAIHELAHALGFGGTDEWNAYVSGSVFTGAASSIEYGGSVPLSVDKAHWANGTMSTVLGTSAAQEVSMDPDLTVGTRKLYTALDAAGLSDIGWTVVPPTGLEGDYNGDGSVDAADYTVWRNNLGPVYTVEDYNVWKTNFGHTSAGSGAVVQSAVPEPSSALLLILCLAGIAIARRL